MRASNDVTPKRRPRATKRGWIALLVVLVLAGGLGAWFLLGGDDEDETPSAQPTPRSAPTTVPGTGGFVDPPEEEKWGTVHFRFEGERDDDEEVLSVYFVTNEIATDLEILTKAKQCVKRNLDEYFGVSCYGFDTEESLEAAEPNPQTGAMAFTCWRAFFSDSEVADKPGKAVATGVTPEECP